MDIRISYEEFSSFVGDVRPIWLESDENLKNKKIGWGVKGDAVEIKSCAGCFHGAFRYGAFMTFVKEGEAIVYATFEDKKYECRVTSRARRDFSKGEQDFFVGDFHTHTSHIHEHDLFLERDPGEMRAYLDAIRDENKRDIAVITDHSETIDLENFFHGFKEYELAREGMQPIVYAGCENEIMYAEKDRFGRLHRVSGELVAINSASFCQANTYPEFFWAFENNPFAIGIFAHPHVIGISTKGVWNYRPRLNNPKELTSLIKYIEVFNSPANSQNMLHEYVYSDALDAGYRVSTTCGSDQHGQWNFDAFTAATIIMAPERSREAFTDALLNLRAYASESGNIKLRYFVNGKEAPCDLDEATRYHFEVKIDYFKEDNSTRPVRCEVISDGGKTVKTIENVNFEHFEFDVESDTARWFYLRFVDAKTLRTFSPPVFTGRAITPYVIDDLKPIDKAGFVVKDENGNSIPELIDDDTFTKWVSSGTTASLTIDMGCVRSVSALGNYAAALDIEEIRAKGIGVEEVEASFPVDYVISASLDGVNYEVCDEGLFRTFAGEEIVRFEKREARFVKLDILSTAGTRLGREAYMNAPIKIAEISLFE